MPRDDERDGGDGRTGAGMGMGTSAGEDRGGDRGADDVPTLRLLADPELHQNLDLVAQVLASLSERTDTQSRALERIERAQVDPEGLAHALHDAGRATLDAARLAALTADQLDHAQTRAAEHAGGLAHEADRATRLVRQLQEATGRASHATHRAQDAADRWHALARRLALWGAPCVLLMALALLVASALAGPRLLAHSPALCRAAGGHWTQDTLAGRTGCWLEGDRSP